MKFVKCGFLRQIGLLLTLMLFLTLLACSEDKSYIMNRETLTRVVKDMNLVELLIENKPVGIKDSFRQLQIHRLCKIYKISKEDIEHDLELISTDYLLLDTIYQNIILMDTLTKIKTLSNDQ